MADGWQDSTIPEGFPMKFGTAGCRLVAPLLPEDCLVPHHALLLGPVRGLEDRPCVEDRQSSLDSVQIVFQLFPQCCSLLGLGRG